MTREETNIMIAEFMGWKNSLEKKNPEYCRWYHPSDLGIMFFPEQLIFDSSWDWLMPVVEKIEQFEFNDGDKAFVKSFGENKVRINRFSLHMEETKLASMYEAVLEFIEWYNMQVVGGAIKKGENGL